MSEHHCHALSCRTPCAPERLMCLKHWRMVPRDVQKKVWATYRPGQCDDMSPSESWHEAADLAIVHVAVAEGLTLAGKWARLAGKLIDLEVAKATASALPDNLLL